MKRVHALIAEDSPDDVELLLRELRRGGYDCTWQNVDTSDAMAEALDREAWDVIFSDWSMPQFDALAALEMVKARTLDVPFIIVSGTVGENTAVAALRSGAHDFIVKSQLARLVPALEREMREAGLRRERRLMQDQLIISDRMASVGLLAAGIAHEINNPLAAILLNLESALGLFDGLAGQDGKPVRAPDLLDSLCDARSAAERVRDIIRDVKLFSRSSEESAGAVDVCSILDSTLRMAWNEIRHRAKLIKDYASVPPVQANESRLGQVFLNLVVNATQAMPEESAERNEIRVATFVDARGRVVVEVADTGSGMPPDVVRRLFTPFFTTKPVGVGTGLGLSICHRIVASLGGEITVESAPGRGSQFRVHLPPAREAERAPAVASGVIALAPRRGHVLVVDDDVLVASALRRALDPEHETTTVTRARAALEIIAGGRRFDVVVCDLMMPEMSGIELYEELRRTVPDQADRVVFLTGGAFTERATAFLAHVPNRRIEKPVETAELRALINELVATDRQPAASRGPGLHGATRRRGRLAGCGV